MGNGRLVVASSHAAAPIAQPHSLKSQHIAMPSQQSALAATPQSLRLQSAQYVVSWVNDDSPPVFVGLQPTGTFALLYPVYETVVVYLVPPDAVNATQVTRFEIGAITCHDAFNAGNLVWRADGKILLALYDAPDPTGNVIMVLDMERQACYPCGGIGSLHYTYISAAFSPDSTRLLLVLDQSSVITLDTTKGMAKAKILPPVAQLSDSYIFNFPVTSNGSAALMTLVGDDDDNDTGGGGADSDDNKDPGIRSMAVIPVAPGIQRAVAVHDAVYFSAAFTAKPVALFGGEFLVSALATDTMVDVRAIAAQTGMIAGRALLDKPKGTNQPFGLQLCSLSDKEAVLFAGGYAHLVSVFSGAAAGNTTQIVVQEGVPVGIMHVSGCTAQQGGASYVGLDGYGANGALATLILLSKV